MLTVKLLTRQCFKIRVLCILYCKSMMDNRLQGHYSTPISNSAESRTSNMYILQVKPSSSEGSLEADAIPLHMLIHEQEPQHQYLIPVVQGKQLQLFIDSRGHPSINPANDQYYSITTEPQTINTELQILNSDIIDDVPSQGHILQNKREAEPRLDTLPLSCNEDKIDKSHNFEQKKKIVQKFVHIADRLVPPRAVAVLPPALHLRRGAVSPRGQLPARVRFGPVEGIKHNLSKEEAENLKLVYTNSGSPLFLLKTEDGTHTQIDVSDQDKANWLSLLPLGDQSTANVWLFQEDHELYAATTKSIPARVPLLLGYSKEYVDLHKLPVEQPVLDLDAELAAKHRQWWCHECQRSMSTAALLQRHMDVYHSEEKPRARARYRCQHCTRSFCRLFTLRRHVARHCTKKAKEKQNESQTTNRILETSKPEDLPDLSTTITVEDSRLPSDESLQTLTNNLDFSTNLFDTDRINLDISGSSRSEDFNPYSLGLKDDIALTATMDFGIDDPTSKKETKKENAETIFLTCRYCKQAVIRGRQRQHVKACTGRKFHCECGRAFLYKDKLALHIHVDHPNLAPDQRRQKSTKEDDLQYKCETCNHKFKRRGMLVNHLWRVHKTSTAVPLEKKVRHYPCITCPKVYRTAAKRDSHVKVHHPGSCMSGKGTMIEGGRVSCAPALCAACPRQYATRAKLLQHVRRHHPALAPPVKKKPSKIRHS